MVVWITYQVPLATNFETVIIQIKDALELNALPKKQVKKYITSNIALGDVYESGGILLLIVVPLAIILTGLTVLLVKCCARNQKCIKLLTILKNVLCYNFILRVGMTTYIAFVSASGIGNGLRVSEVIQQINWIMVAIVLVQLLVAV